MLYKCLENIFLQYRTINLGTGGNQFENVLQRVNDTILTRSVKSVVIHCSSNKIDTNRSYDSFGIIAIPESISKRHPHI